jgi:hypothetical protein
METIGRVGVDRRARAGVSMSAPPYTRVLGWIQAAVGRIDRCAKNEYGCGTAAHMRHSRAQVRCARTLLRRAADELGRPEHSGPAGRYLQDYTTRIAAALDEDLQEMDRFIAEVELDEELDRRTADSDPPPAPAA